MSPLAEIKTEFALIKLVLTILAFIEFMLKSESLLSVFKGEFRQLEESSINNCC